ncbi:MAG: hypothetical protein IPL26_19670 [Leptospiraceae bacterium]|nr:hypothetical protein [Leptospiraceae bacterium]
MIRIFKYFALALVALVAVQFGLQAFGFVETHSHASLLEGIGVLATIPLATYPMGTGIGLGRFAQHHPNEYTETRIAEGDVPFGKAVEVGTAVTQGKLVGGATGEFRGVAAYSPNASKVSEGKYLDKDPLAVHNSGFVTVYVEEAVNAGDAVRIRHTNHASLTAKVAGNFAKTAEAGKTMLLEGARFENSVAAAGEVILFLSGSFKTTADV